MYEEISKDILPELTNDLMKNSEHNKGQNKGSPP